MIFRESAPLIAKFRWLHEALVFETSRRQRTQRGVQGGQLLGPPMRGVPWGVDQFEPPLTPSDVQVSGCWPIPARYASIRRVPIEIHAVLPQPKMAQLVGHM